MYQASFVGYFPAEDPQFTCIVLIRTRPFAASHYGGTLAAPVFREIAGKLYAMYVKRKDPSLYAAARDSSDFYYAGYSEDLRKVYTTLKYGIRDSAAAAPWGRAFAEAGSVVMKENRVDAKTMPDVKGMGLRDALYLLENMGVKVNIKGKGRIISQSPRPGTPIARGVTVILELS